MGHLGCPQILAGLSNFMRILEERRSTVSKVYSSAIVHLKESKRGEREVERRPQGGDNKEQRVDVQDPYFPVHIFLVLKGRHRFSGRGGWTHASMSQGWAEA